MHLRRVGVGEFTVTNGSARNGTYRWTRSLRGAGSDLVSSLPTS